jgi:hypothetical protein
VERKSFGICTASNCGVNQRSESAVRRDAHGLELEGDVANDLAQRFRSGDSSDRCGFH